VQSSGSFPWGFFFFRIWLQTNLIIAIGHPERRGVCAENLAAATPISKGKTNYKPMVDDTKSGFLKREADNAHRRLQQGFEALRPAFSCNKKVKA
jgi:hypothetical protein